MNRSFLIMETNFCGNSSFWDEQLTLNSSWPHFTQCFQSTALNYAPAGFLLVASVIYMPYLLTRDVSASMPNTPLALAKTTLSLILAVGTIGYIIKEATSPVSLDVMRAVSSTDPVTTNNLAYLVALVIASVSYVVTAVLTQLERRCSVIASGVLFIFWFLKLICGIVPLYTLVEFRIYNTDVWRFVFVIVSTVLVFVQLILNSFSDLKLHAHNRYFPANDCPELTASFPSRLTFSWLASLIFKGYKQPLTAADLWRLNPRDSSDVVVGRFTRAWRQLLKRGRNAQSSSNLSGSNNNGGQYYTNGGIHITGYTLAHNHERTPLLGKSHHARYRKKKFGPEDEKPPVVNRRFSCSLFRVLARAFGWEVLLSYLCKMVSDLLQFSGPFLLKGLIIQVQSEIYPEWVSYMYALTILLSSWTQTVFYHQHYHFAMTSGLRMKTALMSAVYKKSLRLDTHAQRQTTTGEVVNLMSVDCQRIQDVMSYSFMIWSIPLQISVAVYLLWTTIGVPVISGVALLLLLVPLNVLMAYHQGRLQRQNLEWKDKRIKMTSEVLSGIKVLKLYAWEESFQARIMEIRSQEVAVLTKLAWINAFSVFLWTCAPYLVCLVSFATYVVIYPGQVLTADMAFVTLALFNILQFPISFIPEMVSFSSQAAVSLRRIGGYLCEAEMDLRETRKLPDSREFAVTIDKGVFTWDPDASFKLTGINIDIPHGCLLAVVGPVGSGKSSLLSAILGEMDRLQGNVHTSGNIAYVPQTPWIQNCTLRDNILFGTSMNQKRYNKVIRACALTHDVETLSGGHDAEIGEKGVNLSGGQKQRVSIARAMYSSADIHIMDDPLSAVDAQVGKHIFKHVLSDKGLLRSKTRILSTHAVHWLPLMDKIIVMDQGRISEVGSYLELMRRVGTFTSFLQTNLRTALETSEEEDADPEIHEMTQKMWQHVESVTSQSEGTSGDDVVSFHHTRLLRIGESFSSSIPSGYSSEERTSPTGSLGRSVGGGVGNGAVVRLTEAETTETGAVKLTVFKSYIESLGRWATVFILISFALYQASSVLANVELSRWTGDKDIVSGALSKEELATRNQQYLTVYGSLGGTQALFIFAYACMASLRMVAASASLHSSMLDRVLRAPMAFFDATPLGRIVNRFSRDIETMDNQLPQIVFMLITCVFSVAATILVICVDTPWFAVVLLPLFVAYLAVQRFFVPTSRQMKRLEAVTRSPIYSHFSETLSGCHVIRAFNAVGRFEQASLDKIDRNQTFYFAGITANRWLGVWIEVISSIVVFLSAVFSLLTPSINAATLGLSITYALQITQALKWLVRTMSDIETNVVSVERVQEYLHIAQEAPRVTSLRPPDDWPDVGEIAVTDYSTSYKPELPSVLNSVSFTIQAGEKVGIVGRTGAGKSSLTLALFRLLEATQGEILIDGIDISAIGLRDLRANITILPQDPVLISGTLRVNLDPHKQYLDQEIWTALGMSNLHNAISSMPAGLDSEVGENGLNLSSGQRQLLCLARALLRRSRILVLDEPTSSVDIETDRLVQTTIKRCFRKCTTLTIAHRIDTILDYDRVMVLDAGKIVEFDSPNTLLEDTSSRFYKMASSARVV